MSIKTFGGFSAEAVQADLKRQSGRETRGRIMKDQLKKMDRR